MKFVYASGKDQVANLSMVVVEEASQGNEQAIQLLKEAGLKLANQVSMLIEKIGMHKSPKVAVTGSVLVKNDIVYETFMKEVKSKYPNGEFVRKIYLTQEVAILTIKGKSLKNRILFEDTK